MRDIDLVDERDSIEIVYSSKHSAILRDCSIPDIDRDHDFEPLFRAVRPHTMTSKEALYALFKSVEYVCRGKVAGDFVECGVWKGGSALLAGLTMRSLGDLRQLHLYDTFEGMTVPTDADVDIQGRAAHTYTEEYGDEGKWCYSGLEDVQATFREHGFCGDQVSYVVGDVLQTLRADLPDCISILRLDTDWYESTRFELETLYPLLSPGGVLIIDDYGHWEGARKAVDEYFAHSPILLNRVNYTVRVGVKPLLRA
jgi:hypothetical protein